MKEVTLTNGHVALVDDVDLETVAPFSWQAVDGGRTLYARSFVLDENKKQKNFFMHVLLLSAPDGFEIDHRDGNGLNCQRHNLRVATRRQNRQNRTRKSPGCTSRFIGVIWSENRWRASIRAGDVGLDGRSKRISLGGYVTEEDAARAYDAAATRYFGEFASLNFPTGDATERTAAQAANPVPLTAQVVIACAHCGGAGQRESFTLSQTLTVVKRREWQSTSEIAETLNVAVNNMANRLAELLELGLVTRCGTRKHLWRSA
jgi:hypothetical protein